MFRININKNIVTSSEPIDYIKIAEQNGIELNDREFWIKILGETLTKRFRGEMLCDRLKNEMDKEIRNWYKQFQQWNTPLDITGKPMKFDWNDLHEKPVEIKYDYDTGNIDLVLNNSLAKWFNNVESLAALRMKMI